MTGRYIGRLPDGYSWKILNINNEIRIFGIAEDKHPLAFMIKNHKLQQINLDPNDVDYIDINDNNV